MNNSALKFLLSSILLFAFACPALAWDDAGHKIVAYIAWQQMSPAAREKAIDTLLGAPEDSDLVALYPTPPDMDFTTYPIGARSKAAKQRDYFMIAAYWADIIRDRKLENRYKYHHGQWHYLDTYWRDANGKVETLPQMDNDKENVVERLFHFDKVLRDASAKASDKAIALAWILHLAGDVHQPLHASGRVTAEEPKGDQGGNTFSLSPKDTPRNKAENLHWYWDSIVVRTVPRRADASDAEYLLPIADGLIKKYPRAAIESQLEAGKFDAWQKESFEIASTKLYPKTLVRNQMPSAAYNKMAYGIAEQRLAIAGYRLGALLNQIFGPPVAMVDAAHNIPCRIIRQVRYPSSPTTTAATRNVIGLLDLCPADRGMQQRPMYPFLVDGQSLMFEYDVVKVFKTAKEARDYAAANGITDVSF